MNITLSRPISRDGAHVHQLIQRCPPLDTNSLYCNLLQCDHFADTSVIAKADKHTVGFISGYLLPSQPQTLFIWQVAVDEAARGQGLANKMLNALLARPHLNQVNRIETTITTDNKASWALFTKFAKHQQATLTKTEYFMRDEHFLNAHDSEWLVAINLSYAPQNHNS